VAQGHSLTGILINFLTPLEGESELAKTHRALLYGLEFNTFRFYDQGDEFHVIKDEPGAANLEHHEPRVWTVLLEKYLADLSPG
jgi:hypothetical protein